MALDDAANIGQSNASTFKFILVKPLEHLKKFADVVHFETGAVVTYEDCGFVCRSAGATDLDARFRPVAREFHGVRQEIDEHLAEHGPIAIDLRQVADYP